MRDAIRLDAAYGPNGLKRQLMPSLAVWMLPNEWPKQNGPPGTVAPEASVAKLQLTVESGEAMYIYSALRLHWGAKAHSMPPPTVHVAVVSLLLAVAMSQLPQPVAVVAQMSMTEPLVGTKAAPPLA